jgi:hypothetical protein
LKNGKKKTGTINVLVTLRRVPATTVAVENQ